MALTYTTSDFTAGSTIVAADVNSRFDDIKSKFNANIINADISTSAAISVDKLDANYEHMLVNFFVQSTSTDDFVWPAANTIVQAIPIYNDGRGSWVVSGGTLVCSDCGANDSQVRFEWGRYTTGTWGVVTTVVSAVAINSDDSSTDTAGQQALTIAAGTLTAGTHYSLAMVSAAAGAVDTLSTAYSFLSASFKLYRKIANG